MALSSQSFEVVGPVQFAKACAGCGRVVPLVGKRYCADCFLGGRLGVVVMSGAVELPRRHRRVAREVLVADQIPDARGGRGARGDAVAAGHVGPHAPRAAATAAATAFCASGRG